MTADTTDVLMFAEDPGAANFVAPLPAALRERGRRAVVLADGIARDYFRERRIAVESPRTTVPVDQIIEAVKPSLILTGTADNPDTLGLALVQHARSAGIASVGVVDAPMHAEYRFCGRTADALAYAPDWLLLPDEWTEEAFVALGFPANRTVVCGHPHNDYVLEKGTELARETRKAVRQRALPATATDRTVIVFVADGSSKLERVSKAAVRRYTLAGRGAGVGRTELVIEEFLDAIPRVSPRPYLVLRPHPKDDPAHYAEYVEAFDHVARDSAPLELVYSADLVVGATSALLAEAALLGRPTLSILPRAEEKEWLPSIRTGVTPYVTTRGELRTALRDLLRRRSPRPCSAHHRVVVTGSVARTVSFLERLLTPTAGTEKAAPRFRSGDACR